MPWDISKVDEFAKGLSDKQKEVWVKIANGALKRCQDAGGSDECEAKAIKTASAMVRNMGESGEPDWDALATLEEAATAKATALRLTRDITALLADRAIPETVRKEAEDLRAALKRTWADLAADADKDGVPDAEEPETEIQVEEETAKEGASVQEGVAAEAVAVVEEALAEDAEGTAILSEGTPDANAQGPLTLRVKLIEPGMGNAKDRHFYGADMLKRNAARFRGAKMFESDHREGEKSTRTWVSTITNVVDYSPTGAPIAEVVVHSPDFAQRVRNLKTAGLLDKLPCSIYAKGNVKSAEMGGEKVNLVEEITDVSSVDWVTRAGAGGQALAIAEMAQDAAEAQPVTAEIIKEAEDMTKEEVMALVESILAEREAKAKEKEEVVIAESKPKVEPKVTGLGERAAATDKQAAESAADKPLIERQAAIVAKYVSG